MAWVSVTIPRRRAAVGMPKRCAYCYGRAEQDLTLRSRRLTKATRGRMTITKLEEHIAIDVPFCSADAERSQHTRVELRRLPIACAVVFGLLALAVVLLSLDAPAGVQIFFGLLAA